MQGERRREACKEVDRQERGKKKSWTSEVGPKAGRERGLATLGDRGLAARAASAGCGRGRAGLLLEGKIGLRLKATARALLAAGLGPGGAVGGDLEGGEQSVSEG